jgi:hypothetical protein
VTALNRCLDALYVLQWSGRTRGEQPGTYACCPECGVLSADRHNVNCNLANAIFEAEEELRPYVCPGCHAVAEECAPGCIDAEMEREAEEDSLFGPSNRFDENDGDEEEAH